MRRTAGDGGGFLEPLSLQEPTDPTVSILTIFYPSLKYIGGCVWLFLQAQKGTIYFTGLAERVEYGNYGLER